MRAAGRFANLPSAASALALIRARKPLDGVGCALTSSGAMRQEDIWDHEAALRYDTPGTGMFAPEVLGPAVDRLAELAGDGRALEFAIGTGRVAIPLSE